MGEGRRDPAPPRKDDRKMPLLDARATTLLAIDLQERLVPALTDAARFLSRARLLLEGGALLGLPVIATEQNPRGLGSTLPGLLPDGVAPHAKTSFDAIATPSIAAALGGTGSVVVLGCETHVCVLQTVLSLRAAGRRVLVVADATASRQAEDRSLGLARMASEGAEIVSAEMVLFEALRDAADPRFRALSALIKAASQAPRPG